MERTAIKREMARPVDANRPMARPAAILPKGRDAASNFQIRM